MSNIASYIAIAVAGMTSLVSVFLLTTRSRSLGYSIRDSGFDDNRQRLDDIDRKLTLLTRYVEEEVPRVVLDGLRAQIEHLSLPGSSEAQTDPAVTLQEESSIVREISHALNTPLAQIEVGALSMQGTTDEQRRKLENILDGVRICKSFLAAFREVATLTRDSHAWSPDSLNTALRAAATFYADRSGHHPIIDVQVPDTVAGYSNSFLMAVLLPLVENAIEAVGKTGTVSVASRVKEGVHHIDVRNDGPTQVLPHTIYDVGFTTKSGHDGLGLAAVRRLLMRRDAHISHQVSNGQVIFTIDLPKGRRGY